MLDHFLHDGTLRAFPFLFLFSVFIFSSHSLISRALVMEGKRGWKRLVRLARALVSCKSTISPPMISPVRYLKCCGEMNTVASITCAP